eukprot:Gb_14537 [translate_table: standard]
MEFWPEFLATSWGKEFLAGGFGGMAGVIAGHPLDTLRIRLQQPMVTAQPPSALRLLRNIVTSEGPSALYRGMGPPLASVAFQMPSSEEIDHIRTHEEMHLAGYEKLSSECLPICWLETNLASASEIQWVFSDILIVRDIGVCTLLKRTTID